MTKKIITIICFLFFSCSSFSQNYSDSVFAQNILEFKDKSTGYQNINKIKMINKRFMNKMPKTIHYFIQYNNDTINRYWWSGNQIDFYKNGKTRCITYSNFDKGFYYDSIFYYDINGKLSQILRNKSKPNDFRIIRLFKFPECIIKKCYIKLPNFTEIENFDNGILKEKYTQIYNGIEGKYVVDGEVKYFTSEGGIEKIEYYKLGTKVMIEKH